MNIRNIDEYNIGLDIGTGSVGWAVTDSDGNLLHFKGKPMWGSRIFPSANTAEEARIHRGQRRRYDRRRRRLNLLQSLFAEEMEKTDAEFFIRMNQSRLIKEDRDEGHRDYLYPFFNDAEFSERDYYDRFPTIYHLRKFLMESDDKADIRLIYLAFHNIVKTRGNFLYQDNPSLTAKDADARAAVEHLCSALQDWCEFAGLEVVDEPDAQAIQEIAEDTTLSKAEKKEKILPKLKLGADNKKAATAICNAILGYSAEFGHLFGNPGEGTKFTLGKDDAIESYRSQIPAEGESLFEALISLYSSIILMGMLKGSNGETISYCKVRDYEKYKSDLALLKSLVKQYQPDKYDEFFRGQHFEDPRWKKDYDPSEAKGYTLYNLKRGRSYDDFKKDVVKLFEKTDAVEDVDYKRVMAEFNEEAFLRRLKTSDNGSIPYQLHLEEMKAIIGKQGKHHPFLLENQNKLESLVTFRIPYYVGPLTQKNAPKDSSGKNRFAWSERKVGKEGEVIYPWNWEEIIDKDRSAEAFIQRMTGTCTYLYGEPVLPKCSLLYERYCVLNELNGATWTQDGDKWHRFDAQDRMDIVSDLFERGSVSYKKVEDWLKAHNRAVYPHVRGGQGEARFESKLSSHMFFCKLLDVDELSGSQTVMVEEIILWNTLFEDRSILKDKLYKKYGVDNGGVLSDEQIKAICKKRFTGWGRLSRKLLLEVRTQTPEGERSIMDILEEGDPYGERIGEAMVFMEVLRDEHLGFQEKVDAINLEKTKGAGGLSIDDLQGSPALKRSVNQAMRIVDEIVSIARKQPTSIFIESTRDDDVEKKGKRTPKRYDALKTALENLKKEGELNKEVLDQLKGKKPNELDDRLMLYFSQNGKSMYSGKELRIEQLSTYHIDHIIPQAYTTDDSLENRVLVLQGENERKSDDLLVPEDVRRQMLPMWRMLQKCGLIGEKKLRNLSRDRIDEKQLKGFINRQLVETGQIVKHTRLMLGEKYPDVQLRSIKASLSHDLRKALKLAKCRQANDYHHAHDAFLACSIGRFIELYFHDAFENPIRLTHAVRAYVKRVGADEKKLRFAPGSTSFLIGSFLREQVNAETGEIWEPDKECKRIKSSFGYKDCYISRMLEITSGAFWDATIYSPKGSEKGLALPVKKNLDPKTYGSFSREQFAYFFMYRARKKGKEFIDMAGVPVSVAAEIEHDKERLTAYAQELANKDGAEFIGIVRSRIYKNQVISVDGARLFITGLIEVRNGVELAFSLKDYEVLSALADQKETTAEQRIQLYDYLTERVPICAPRLRETLSLTDSTRETFVGLNGQEQESLLLGIINLINGNNRVVDLTTLGGKKFVGAQALSYKKVIATGTLEIIDASVTGMFERRTRIEL